MVCIAWYKGMASTHGKAMRAIASQTEYVQAQAAARAEAQDREKEVALQKAQDQEVSHQPNTHMLISALVSD